MRPEVTFERVLLRQRQKMLLSRVKTTHKAAMPSDFMRDCAAHRASLEAVRKKTLAQAQRMERVVCELVQGVDARAASECPRLRRGHGSCMVTA